MNKADIFHNQMATLVGLNEWKELEEMQKSRAQEDSINQMVNQVVNKLKNIKRFKLPSVSSKEQLADSVLTWLTANLGNINKNDNDLLQKVSQIFKKSIGIEAKISKIKNIREIVRDEYIETIEDITDKTEPEIINLINGNSLNLYQKSLILLKLNEQNKSIFETTLDKINLDINSSN